MGEYIEDAPNHNKIASADVVAQVAGICGVPPEQLGAVVIVATITTEDGVGFVFGGNLDEDDMAEMIGHGYLWLRNAIRNQRLADLVPDDISSLFPAGE